VNQRHYRQRKKGKEKKNHTGDRREKKNKGENSKVYTETNFRDVVNIGMSLYKYV
jgi:hypothetical protein